MAVKRTKNTSIRGISHHSNTAKRLLKQKHWGIEHPVANGWTGWYGFVPRCWRRPYCTFCGLWSTGVHHYWSGDSPDTTSKHSSESAEKHGSYAVGRKHTVKPLNRSGTQQNIFWVNVPQLTLQSSCAGFWHFFFDTQQANGAESMKIRKQFWLGALSWIIPQIPQY